MELTEKTLESKRIFEGRIVNLRVDTVELPNGRVSTREVVEHKGAVAIVPMLDHQTIVLVRQFRQPAGRVLVEIPAGRAYRTHSAGVRRDGRGAAMQGLLRASRR